MKISVILVEPRVKGHFEQELKDCIDQLDPGELGSRVVSTTVFLNANDNESFTAYREITSKSFDSFFKDLFSVNYVCQPPARGSFLALEIHLISENEYHLENVDHKGIRYVRARLDNTLKGIFVSGIQCGYEEGVLAACNDVFESMEAILTREGLSFNHIVRQWNYIEDILKEDEKEGIIRQHYQIFNDVRTRYYNKVSFENGYPAATGIGNKAGGVAISFYALNTAPDVRIYQVDNALQKPAYQYPDQVLVGDRSTEFKVKATPKFVRAKHVENSHGHMTFISGTASIRKEKTVAVNDMPGQLLITMENMEHLISYDTLLNSGVGSPPEERIDYYRGYVKNLDCIGEIIRKCEELLPGVPYILLVSDICRKDLLIEIEAFSS
jgi:enamine deaminase RidA (YjgF/YER057c/UK114 family)